MILSNAIYTVFYKMISMKICGRDIHLKFQDIYFWNRHLSIGSVWWYSKDFHDSNIEVLRQFYRLKTAYLPIKLKDQSMWLVHIRELFDFLSIKSFLLPHLIWLKWFHLLVLYIKCRAIRVGLCLLWFNLYLSLIKGHFCFLDLGYRLRYLDFLIHISHPFIFKVFLSL